MKLRKKAKGFTIIELVIVIAVIAVLAAVLIPTFINLTAKANKAADDSLVTSLNKALAIEEVDNKPQNMHDAVEGLKREGYLASALVTKSDQKLLYNLEENRFLLEEDKKQGVADRDYWTIQESYNSASQQYSIYAADNFSSTEIAGLKVGFDSGDCKTISSINYVGTGEEQHVVIRTNTVDTNLTINAATDTVSHFDSVGKVTIDNINMDCYNEFGKAAYVKLSVGKVIAKQSGEIKVIFATNADASKVAVIKEKGTINAAYTTAEVISTTNAAREGGIALTYSVNDQPVTEELVNGYANAAVEENKIEEVEKTGLYEARIGAVGYATFDDAASAILSGQTLVLLKDVVRVETVSVTVWDKPFNIDLNNHTYETKSDVDVTLGNNGYKASAFCFAYDGTTEVTIKNGTIKTKYGAPVYAASKTVILENVTLYQDHNNFVQTTPEYSSGVRVTSAGAVVINSGTYEGYYAIAASNSGAQYTINGGAFTGALFFSSSTDSGKTKTITINGGNFVNFSVVNPNKGTLTINGGTFDADPSAYVAAGHHATNNGNGTWTVSAD